MLIYFILLINILLFGFIANHVKDSKVRVIYLIIVFFLLMLIASLRDPSVGIDLNLHYGKNYLLIKNYSWNQIQAYSNRTTYEIGYCYFCKLLSTINPNIQFFIATTSIFSILPVEILVYKYSEDYCMSSVLFLCYCLFYMYMNIIRQALAVGVVCIACIVLMSNKSEKIKNIGFILLVVIASTIHQSAILCLLLLIVRKVKFNPQKGMLVIPVGVIVLVNYQILYNIIIKILGETNKYERYIDSITEGVGSFNMQSLANFFLVFGAYIIACLTYRKSNAQFDNSTIKNSSFYHDIRNEEFEIWMVGIAAVCRLLIFKMNIIARFSYYFLPFILLVYPNILKYMKRYQRKYVKKIIYFIFILYFIWMTVKYANLFYGAVPYKFFWQ